MTESGTVVARDGERREERLQGGTVKLVRVMDVHYLDCGNGFMGVYICQKL